MKRLDLRIYFNNKTGLYFFIAILIFKVLLSGLFSSDYQDKLFFPFLSEYLQGQGNPWETLYSNPKSIKEPSPFPYPSLMLYILSPGAKIAMYFESSGIFWKNLFFKLPNILADLWIFSILCLMFPLKKSKVVMFYFSSPIIVYAVFMHSQLDLIPTAFLLAGIYYLTVGKTFTSSILTGLAITSKLHTAVALPFIFLFLYRNKKFRDLIPFLITPFLIYGFFSFPNIFNEGYRNLVLFNSKQKLLFDTFYMIGNSRLLIAVFILILLYARFSAYPRINKELLFSFLAIGFSVFVFFIEPAPAWYVWILPFAVVFFIEYTQKRVEFVLLYIFFFMVYLLYFVTAFVPEMADLKFLGKPWNMKIQSILYRDMAYTLLQATLFALAYSLYKFGVKRNRIYMHPAHGTVIGISGDSSVGKTTLLQDLKSIFHPDKILMLEGDGEHKWERGNQNWEKLTHLNPKANYLYVQAENISSLKNGFPIHRSDYDHSTGTFTEPILIKPKEFILISGLHTFYLPRSRKLIDIKIYMDTDEKLRKHWKVIRDTKERGYSNEKIMKQIESRISDAEKYIYPQKEYADLVFRYFTNSKFTVGDPNAKLEIGLKVTLDANINLELLIHILGENNCNAFYDYESDLKRQYIILTSEVNPEVLLGVKNVLAPDVEELTDCREISFKGGYRGFIQLMILLILNEKFKVDSHESV